MTGDKPTESLKKVFLGPAGWLASFDAQRPITASGKALPWFTYGAIEFLNRVVWPGARVFEYGAGFSTLWWQDRASMVESIDHDANWVDELEKNTKDTVQLRHVPIDSAEIAPGAEPYFERFFNRPRKTDWDYDAGRVIRRGLEDKRFGAYASSILSTDADFDFIVIDGMARRLCTEFAVDRLHDDGMIILDNSNRSDYDTAFEILRERGFRQLPFWGLVPGATFLTCTSFFVRSLERLPDGNHVPNSLRLPEY